MKFKQFLKHTTALFMLAFLLVTLAACGGTAELQDVTPSPEKNVTPNVNPDENPDEETPAPSWTPPPIPVENTKIDPSQTGDLVIWIPPFCSWGTHLIDNYKELYPNVNVIVEDFSRSAAAERDAYSTRLNAELAANKGPDVLFPFQMYNSDNYKTADAGAFLDLNELIEQDSDFNLDDYIKGVLDSGIYQGKRYVIPYSYSPSVYISGTSKLDEIGFDRSKKSNAVSFMNEIVRTMPKAMENPKSKSMFNGNYLLWSLLELSGIRFADFENKIVLPDKGEMKNILEAYKPYYNIDFTDIGVLDPLEPSYFADGSIIFSKITIGDIFYIASQKIDGGYEMTVIPGIDGKIRAATGNTAAIRSGSQNVQNAWNFIKLMLSPGFQTRRLFTLDMPVHKDSFIFQAGEWYASYDREKNGVIHSKISEAEMQMYLDLLMNVDACNAYRTMANRKFLDYMEPYLKDERSYEDCLAMLRNDLTLYVSE